MSRTCSVPEQREQNDNGDRNPKQPEQDASAHFVLLFMTNSDS